MCFLEVESTRYAGHLLQVREPWDRTAELTEAAFTWTHTGYWCLSARWFGLEIWAVDGMLS